MKSLVVLPSPAMYRTSKKSRISIILKAEAVKDLRQIPGVGISIANDLWNIGIKSIEELKGLSPETIYERSNKYAGMVQDRCLLYVFRCAVYYADTQPLDRDPEKLKWWNWKNAE